jgi:hypothetical protein
MVRPIDGANTSPALDKHCSRLPEFSPFVQKTKLLLTAAGVPFERVDVPALIPRKDLESIGITYRRVPILAIGKDVYCDSKLIFDVVLNKLAKGKIPTSVAVRLHASPYFAKSMLIRLARTGHGLSGDSTRLTTPWVSSLII